MLADRTTSAANREVKFSLYAVSILGLRMEGFLVVLGHVDYPNAGREIVQKY